LEIAALQLDTVGVLQTTVLLDVSQTLVSALLLGRLLQIQFRLMPSVVERRMLLALGQRLATAALRQAIVDRLMHIAYLQMAVSLYLDLVGVLSIIISHPPLSAMLLFFRVKAFPCLLNFRMEEAAME
jgi:hypothetical protein